MAILEWNLHRNAVGQKGVNVILCDDDPAFLHTFRDDISLVFEKLNVKVEIAAFGRSDDIPVERLVACDMAFFDIDFEDEVTNGIDIARKLREHNQRTLIFFVTNFIDYAPAGYEVRAFRYILKRDRGDVLERYIMQAIEQLADEQEYLRLSGGDEVIDIPLDRISYIEVMNHDVSIHTVDGSHTLPGSLSSLEDELGKCGFLRIHNSYLVNMRYIGKYRSRECILNDGTVLPVSERNYSAQKQKYLLWKGLK